MTQPAPLLPSDLLKQKESRIVEEWLKEIQENPRFAGESLKQHIHLKKYSKHFLDQIIETLDNKDLEKLTKEAFEPLFQIWHKLLNEQMQQGLSTKETALLIYTLKTSLTKTTTLEENVTFSKQILQLEHLFDLLGMLIFEMYTAEKERSISQKIEHIHYLQDASFPDLSLISKSPFMNDLFKAIELILDKDISILLEGETGVGKDVIASLIHKNSNRQKHPFVALNCGAIPKELIESELFGHEKGAFTGAEARRIGKFEQAHEGTLFLDEIGEMPIDLQIRLLRVLQNKEIERIGSNTPIPINVRIIAATNKNLKSLVDTQKFRLDLYYRLNVYPIHVPPLRERREDILPLSYFFIEKYSKQFNVTPCTLTADAEHFLLNHTWEGNIRELENLIQRAVILCQSKPITSTILSLKPGQETLPVAQYNYTPLDVLSPLQSNTIIPLDELEKEAIIHALKTKKNNLVQVAKALGISRTTLYNKLEKYQITPLSEK